jgi:adenylate cyclase
MFTDIAGFTTITENLPPARLAEALHLYLDALTAVIQRDTGGTIDKYIGDAIMTFWNAPEPLPDHALRACNAALRCREAEEALMASDAWRGLPQFRTRFGLHCGPAIVGHFGGSERLNYTAVGDTVNLAARLEGLNKTYGTTIIASEAIVRAVGGTFVFRQLDIVAAKGKQQATRIYELLGPAATPRTEVVERYERAFDFYQRRRFQEAIPLLAENGADAPSAVLLARCRAALVEAPPDDWNGTYIAQEK